MIMSKSMNEKQQPTAVDELVAVDDDVEELTADLYEIPVPFEVDDVPDPLTLTSEEYLQLMETPEIRALINLYREGDFCVPPSPLPEAFAAAAVNLPPGANQEAMADAVEDPVADIAQDAVVLMVANPDQLEGN